MLKSNLAALAITFALSLVWLRLNDFAAVRGWVSSSLSRKIIHMGTGPLFVLCWLLFNDEPASRFLAALVPLAITLQFALVGTGVLKDPAAVQAMSRTGDRSEILRGPLFYGIVFVVLTIVFWKYSPTGIMALMLLCGGDGLADVIGKRLGRNHLPWSPKKTWIGSIGMFIGGLIFSVAVIGVYLAVGILPGNPGLYIAPVLIISAIGTVIESLPLNDYDNLTVPIVAVALGLLLFPSAH